MHIFHDCQDIELRLTINVGIIQTLFTPLWIQHLKDLGSLFGGVLPGVSLEALTHETRIKTSIETLLSIVVIRQSWMDFRVLRCETRVSLS